MSQPWFIGEEERFPGVWVNQDGNVLVIEKSRKPDKFFVSFAPTPEASPVIRKFYENRPTIRMSGQWRTDLDSLEVTLGLLGNEPWLDLSPESSGFYYPGPCLVPGIITYDSRSHSQPFDLTWLGNLKPYRLVAESEWQEYQLFRYLRGVAEPALSLDDIMGITHKVKPEATVRHRNITDV